MGYTLLGEFDLAKIFQTTGLFQPLAINGQPSPTWEIWDESIKHLNPLRGNGTDRGISGLKHEPQYDKIIDLCDNSTIPGPPQPLARLPQPAVHSPVLSNRTPQPNGSWLVFDASLGVVDDGTMIASIQLGKKDTTVKPFNPAEATIGGASFDDLISDPLKDFVEEQGTKEYLVWSGYAERIGYPVPKPGKVKIDGITLTPTSDPGKRGGASRGPVLFEQKFLGMHFGVPKYGAVWRTYYKIGRKSNERPAKVVVQYPGDPTQFEAGGPQS
jgi:hypothetical protein